MGWFPQLEDVAVQADIPADILKIAIGFAAVLALSTQLSHAGPLFRVVSNRTIRHILSVTFGTLFLLFMLEEIAFFFLFGVVAPYFLMVRLPRPFLTSMLCSLALLLAVHSYRFMYPSLHSASLTCNGKWTVQST
jgi:hypothetical protein